MQMHIVSAVNFGSGAKGVIKKMQEVFEKIIEKLEDMKQGQIKLLAMHMSYEEDQKAMMRFNVLKQAQDEVKCIINQYNNGWIPASERLPEEHKLYDITFRNSVGIHSDSAIFIPSIRKWFWDADETEFVENEILAWAEKREPYQPKGE